MDASAFEFNLTLPADSRFAGTLRDLAAHAVRYAGGADGLAREYAEAVEVVARECLAPARAEVAVVVRRGSGGPLEILVECERRFEVPGGGAERITIRWTDAGPRPACRVALDL